jgi:hypothetical protein
MAPLAFRDADRSQWPQRPYARKCHRLRVQLSHARPAALAEPATGPDAAPAPTGGPMPLTPPTSGIGPRPEPSPSSGRTVLPLVPGLERRPARRRPLPDAVAVRLLMVPDTAPPYDDHPAAAGPRRAARTCTDIPGEPTAQARDGAPGPAAQARDGAPGPTAQARDGAPGPAAQARDGAPGPDRLSLRRRGPTTASGWPSQFAQVLAETLAGSRPQGQIAAWTTDQARKHIRQLGPMLSAGAQPRVRRIVTSRPALGVVEMTVVVGCGPRTRALAIRLERAGPHRPGPGPGPGRNARTATWICTAIEAA